jgi:polysaccharide pyruvyl transferase WcaK-like protein
MAAPSFAASSIKCLNVTGVEPNPCNAILRLKLHLFLVRFYDSKFLALFRRIRVIATAAMKQNERRTGVLLSGYYGCGNLGDDLLLTVTVEELRAILPNAHFLLRDHGARLPKLGSDVIPTGIDTIIDDQRHSRLYRLTSFSWHIAGLLRQCRWLIFAGGTVFHDDGGLASLALQWLLCRLARVSGVRVAALGVGVGNLRTKPGRWLLRGIVSRCELFLVRDDAALRQCAGTKARLTDDLVFVWRSLTSENTRNRTPGKPGSIGLTVSPKARERTVVALAHAVQLWRDHGHRVVFLIFQQSDTVADDSTVFANINNKLAITGTPIEVRHLTANAAAISEAFSDIDVVCGMRFHGLVLAAMLERPFVGIAHDSKISEICGRFDMPCHDAAILDGTDLAQSAEDIHKKVPESRPLDQSRRLAKENFLAFASLSS